MRTTTTSTNCVNYPLTEFSLKTSNFFLVAKNLILSWRHVSGCERDFQLNSLKKLGNHFILFYIYFSTDTLNSIENRTFKSLLLYIRFA